jgi:catechol 2,3-dioxygenase
MKVLSLGHVVIRVRNQQRAEAFYNGLLGLPIAARFPRLSMTFFTLGNHHDFAIAAVGDDAPPAPANSPGLVHVAFKIGDTLEALREARDRLAAAGVQCEARDHVVSQSIYFDDPDGNRVELYVDSSAAWKQEPDLVASSEPMQL